MSKFEKKAINFSKTCSSLKKRFFGHVECSFDTSQEIFWPQAFKNGSKSKIYGKNTYFEKKNFFSKLSSGPIESSFDKRLFLLKVREWQNRSPNLRKKLLKIIFCSRIMQFRDRSRKILPFSQRFCLKIWKRFFSKKNNVLKNFPWALPTAIRPPYQNCFAKSTRNVWSKPEKHGKQIFRNKSFFSQNDPQRS